MKEAFFLYKSAPFRPLYHGTGLDKPSFRLPPTRDEQSIRREKLHLWYFVSRSVARQMAVANHCEYALSGEFKKLNKGFDPEQASMKPERARRLNEKPRGKQIPSLEELA